MTKTIAILQADSTTCRFLTQSMACAAGEPPLLRLIERVQRAYKVDDLVVATSTAAADDPVIGLCRRLDVACYRGVPGDALTWYHEVARAHAATHGVRVTADCVLTDPALIDDVIASCHRGRHGYCSNVTDRTYPLGLDVEVFTVDALSVAWSEARDAGDRAYVTSFLRRNPLRFRHGLVKDGTDRSWMRWAVRGPADLPFVEQVYDALYPFGPLFSREDVFELLDERPELMQLQDGRRHARPRAPERLAA